MSCSRRSRPAWKTEKWRLLPELTNGFGFGSTEFHVLRPNQGMDPRYLYYYVSDQAFVVRLHRMTGAVGQKRVPSPF